MNLVIKSLYVVAAMALLVALAGIANAATATRGRKILTPDTRRVPLTARTAGQPPLETPVLGGILTAALVPRGLRVALVAGVW